MAWIVALPDTSNAMDCDINGTTKTMDPGPWIVVLSGTTNAMECGMT